jgi:predicted nucleotidyltransferase
MTKTACMICGKEPPFDFQITRERDKEQDPDRKELEIHIKRNHSLEEIQKHANPSEFGRRKKAKADEQQEQEGEEAVKTDDMVAELFKEEKTGTTKSASRSRSSRGSSRSRRSTRSTPAVVEETRDANSADL